MQQKSVTKIQFTFQSCSFTFKERMKLKVFLNKLLAKEGRKLEAVRYIFCSDRYLLAINKKFLSHNFYTDIITFDLTDSFSSEAEIYISVERVKSNAGEYNATFIEELHRVIFHGALHLCGYKDKTRQEKTKMREREDYILKNYFLA